MRARALLFAMLVAGCSHGEPFRIADYRSPLPDTTAVPFRLTYNAVLDSEAAWLPDGSGIIYTSLRPDFPDTTFCVHQIPPGGGQVVRDWCPIGSPDSSRAYDAPSISPTGRFMYLRSARTRGTWGWAVRQLIAARLDATERARVLLTEINQQTPPFADYNGLSEIRWLDGDRFVFRADYYFVAFCLAPCQPFEGDSGRYVVYGDLRTDPATMTKVPGTDTTTGLAAIDADHIAYTLQGRTAVFRRALSSGTVDTLWDFAPDIPDDVQVSGSRLAAVLAGTIHLVDLAARTDSLLATDTAPYSGLALSPDGKRLVAQKLGDLWEFVLP